MNEYDSWVASLKTIDWYRNGEGLNERTDFLEHAGRVSEIVDKFGHNLVPNSLFEIAILHDLPDRLLGDDQSMARRKRAAQALDDRYHLPGMTQESIEYSATILHDLMIIETVAERYRTTLQIDTNAAIPPEMFLKLGNPDLVGLLDIASNTNMEAVILKAAESLDNLMHPPKSPRALLHDLIEAETVYAPLLEIWGLDAMAARLRSEVCKLQLEMTGGQEYLATANDLHERTVGMGADKALELIFGEYSGDVEYRSTGLSEGETSIFVTRELKTNQFDFTKVIHRIKSIGSLAKKIKRQDGELPMDVLGVTIVADDESMAHDFGALLDSLGDNPSVRLQNAPSKKFPVCVQGSREYLDRAKDVLDVYGVTDIDEDERSYQVLKVTFMVLGENGVEIPVELQMLTSEDRRNSRVGPAAHILFKQYSDHSMDAPEEKTRMLAMLEAIAERRQRAEQCYGQDCGARVLDGDTVEGGRFLLDIIRRTLQNA